MSKDPGFEESARKFMLDCGLEPTDDAVGQLTYAFLPCLKIMIDRAGDDYNYGEAWRESGWRGCLFKVRERMDRLWVGSWLQGKRPRKDTIPDMINYLAFMQRCMDDKAWGDWGAPSPILEPHGKHEPLPWPHSGLEEDT
jgi:hypothetical protein